MLMQPPIGATRQAYRTTGKIPVLATKPGSRPPLSPCAQNVEVRCSWRACAADPEKLECVEGLKVQHDSKRRGEQRLNGDERQSNRQANPRRPAMSFLGLNAQSIPERTRLTSPGARTSRLRCSNLVDLLDEGADCLRYFGCRARVACSNQLAHLITDCSPSIVNEPIAEF